MRYILAVARVNRKLPLPSYLDLWSLGVPVAAISRYATVRKHMSPRALRRRVQESRN